MKYSVLLLAFLFPMLLCSQTTVTIDSTTLTERVVATGLNVPWEILWGPDDYIWVTEKAGKVSRIDPVTGNITEILDITNLVDSGSEPGLLGMALHPDFANTPHVFLVYNYSAGWSYEERLVRYEWNGTNLVNGLTLLDNIPAGNIHNGSRLLITADEKILMTTGDTGSGNLAQNMNSLSGKLLRINLDGTVPTDNPISGSYIYTYGHRNAQGLNFGPEGKVYSSEHGAQQSDEFNLIIEGRNYGWPNVEGACNTNTEINFCNGNNVVEPLKEWSPCPAVNGIEYYNHPSIPEWENSFLMAVLGGLSGGRERISVLHMNADGTAITSEDQYFDDYGRLRDLCVNPNTGAIYFATNGPNYPSNGPNQIVEYRNLDYNPSVPVLNPTDKDQFMLVFPNPAIHMVTIQTSSSFVNHPFELISYNGQVVKKGIITSEDFQLNVQDLPVGFYYVKANNQQGTITQTLVINK